MVRDPTVQPGLPADFLWGFATASYVLFDENKPVV
jgi:hypothetical protein